MKRTFFLLFLLTFCTGVSYAGNYVERLPGVNLRIFDDNIWDYSKDNIPEPWKKLGVDCRDDHRAPQFASLILSYMPDIVTFQEYSRHMHDRFYPYIESNGYAICHTGEEPWNNTPVFYRPSELEMIECIYQPFVPEQWNNHNSKSYTCVVFRHRATDRVFGVVSTHLWWKGEKTQAGSDFARASQILLIMAQVQVVRSKYKCPVFLLGDMNCEEKSLPIRCLLENGYTECYTLATVYGDSHNGHHICAPRDGFSAKSRRRGPDRATGAIDHILVTGLDDFEIKVFDCIMDECTLPLTDHYPNLLDISIPNK